MIHEAMDHGSWVMDHFRTAWLRNSQQVLNNLKQFLPRKHCRCGVSNASFLPVHGHLTVDVEKQSAGAANLQRLGPLTAESHFAWLLPFFHGRFVQHDAGEILRKCNLWKLERVENQFSMFV